MIDIKDIEVIGDFTVRRIRWSQGRLYEDMVEVLDKNNNIIESHNCWSLQQAKKRFKNMCILYAQMGEGKLNE